MGGIPMTTWYRVHKWTSLVSTVFLLLLCLTGLPLIFGDEIDAVFDPEVAISAVAAGTPDASLDRIIAAAHARYPGQHLRFMVWDKEEPRRLSLNMAASADATAAQGHVLIYDTRTAALLSETPALHGFMHVMLQLHQNLFIGLTGDLLLGVVGLLFLAALVSGVVLYGPYMRKLDFGAVRFARGRRLRWLDLHNLIGVAVLAWMCAVGLTGFINTLSKPLFGLWSAQEMPRLLAQAAQAAKDPKEPQCSSTLSVDAIVAAARRALPDKRISSVVFPGARFGSAQHYTLWTVGNTPLTSRMFTPILLDACSGRIVSTSTLPWYLKALELSRPLHFGDYGGLPLKIIWALLDLLAIAVLVSGIYLWIARNYPGMLRPADEKS
ncbi:PepSY domain-containing protein [Herbaspirillum lusitanum]|uniref:PepSY-associated TM helix domain-containing protein n=1 Tax=Herbaspirillum lusitanum TaxID=213312 RepID=UPI0022378948|nr:PepSY domain-containing protein [Herbaspirillum lusitanum]MCW5300985.1 PepSY domain-containing protein [Herbaspirillum lusitanum]